MQVERIVRGLPLTVSGERVSNTWATCPPDGDNAAKAALIPDKDLKSHGLRYKGGLYRKASRRRGTGLRLISLLVR